MGYDAVHAVECGTPVEHPEREQTIEDRPSRLKRAAIVLVAVLGLIGVVHVAKPAGTATPTAALNADSSDNSKITWDVDVCTHCVGTNKCEHHLTKHECLHDGGDCEWKPNRCGTDDDDDDDSSYSYSYGSDAMLI